MKAPSRSNSPATLAPSGAAGNYIIDGKRKAFVGRNAEMLDQLLAGPVPAPSIYRRASYVNVLRQAGVKIETVFQKSANGVRFGIYHLRSRVSRA